MTETQSMSTKCINKDDRCLLPKSGNGKPRKTSRKKSNNVTSFRNKGLLGVKAKTVREELDRKRSFWGGDSRNKIYQQPLNTTTVSSTNFVGYQPPLLGQYYPYMPSNHHSSLKSTHTAFTAPATTASSNNNNCTVIQYGSMRNSAPLSQDASIVKAANYNDIPFQYHSRPSYLNSLQGPAVLSSSLSHKGCEENCSTLLGDDVESDNGHSLISMKNAVTQSSQLCFSQLESPIIVTAVNHPSQTQSIHDDMVSRESGDLISLQPAPSNFMLDTSSTAIPPPPSISALYCLDA